MPATDPSRRPLVLVGYRGTGKTSLAKLLAQRLGWDWMDADVELERRAGKTIRQIFQEEGEPAFRDLESAVLTDLMEQKEIVVATGGGVVIRSENREVLGRARHVIWLTASAETILARMQEDQTTADRRPQLTQLPPTEEVQQLLAEREPLYREVSQWEVCTEGKTPRQVADEIFQRLDLPPAPPESN